jgi:CheY-like chemotaxis protein
MDDEDVMRETLQSMLVSVGYTVVCKENGNDAVAFVFEEMKQGRNITGAIFDLTVPGAMGGKAAVEEIKKSYSSIPVFVASGYAEDPIMKDPAKYGFTASICKPFRKTELIEMLNRYV